MWAWMVVLLQFWEDHATTHLFGGRFHRMSSLAGTLIKDINVWLPTNVRFGWPYVTQHASLWLDVRDLFGEEHIEEWESQECRAASLNDLERETEATYQHRILTKQDDKRRADSKEAATRELPPEQHAEHEQRWASTMPPQGGVSSTSAGVPLYPNWVPRPHSKPPGLDMPTPYRTPREGATSQLSLAEELDEASVLDPLNSSQPDSTGTPKTEGPKTPPHYCDTTAVIPPFDLTQLGIFPKMSPVTAQENELLNLAPGFPVRQQTLPGPGPDQSRSQRSSYSGSPMSLGSPAGVSNLACVLQVCTRPNTPGVFNASNNPPIREDDDFMDAAKPGIEDDQE